MELAWAVCNDVYLFQDIVKYSPNVIACASLHFAAKSLGKVTLKLSSLALLSLSLFLIDFSLMAFAGVADRREG
jgi:hypothetical protein